MSNSTSLEYNHSLQHPSKPTPPPPCTLSVTGRLAFLDFGPRPDEGEISTPRSPRSGYVILLDPAPLDQESPFKKAWNNLETLCHCRLGFGGDITLSAGLFCVHRGVPGIKLLHNFLVVSFAQRHILFTMLTRPEAHKPASRTPHIFPRNTPSPNLQHLTLASRNYRTTGLLGERFLVSHCIPPSSLFRRGGYT